MKLFYTTTLIIFLGLLSGCSTSIKLDPKHTIQPKQQKDKTIFSLKQGKELDLKALMKEVEQYPVIFVGDDHDTKKTHEFFKSFLDELGKNGYKIHLANEWFTPEHNSLLKEFTDKKIDTQTLKTKREWDKFTRHRWDLVSPLYESVRDSGGRLYGVNISKKDRKKISLRKFNEMSSKEKAFYDSLDLQVSGHRSLVMPYFNHCHKMKTKTKESCSERMYRVQVTWDSYMAQESYKIGKKVLKTNKDKLIVFAGAMHVEYGLGIPLRFARLSNLPYYIFTNHQIDQKQKTTIDPQRANGIFLYKKEEKK
ncbi:MAG: ChaN family lipoprotein [Campylobacterales bacterium]|nr:ChaN family lipoprotein [Campylobacterales bacterium]